MLPKDFDKKMRLELMAGNLVKAFKSLFIDVIVAHNQYTVVDFFRNL